MFYEPSELRSLDKAIVSSDGCQDEQRALLTPKADLDLMASKKPRRYSSLDGGWIDPKLTALYVITSQTNNLCKIGYARNLKTRISSMQCGSPVPISLAHFVYVVGRHVAVRVEAAAHEALADRWGHGEWFDTTVTEAAAAIYSAIREGGFKWWDERGFRAIGRRADQIHVKALQRIYRLPKVA